MPTTAWSVARPDISREIGFVEFTTTTNITTNQLVISTTLADRYTTDGYFIGWFILFQSGNNTGRDNLRITDYAASTGQLTVAGAALSSDSGAITCELHRFPPRTLRDHFNRARQDLYPLIGIQRDLQTIVTGQKQTLYTLPTTWRGKPRQVFIGTRADVGSIAENIATDGGFENWDNSTTLASWTGSTVTEEVETTTPKNYMVLEGGSSAQFDNGGSNLRTLFQSATPSQATESVELNLSVWVYNIQTATNITALFDSAQNAIGAANRGTAHGGTGWELLTANMITAVGGTVIGYGVEIAATAQAVIYVDELTIVIGQSEPYDTGWEPLLNWQWIPPVGGASNGGTIEFPYILGEKKRLRIVGMDLLSSVSSDTGTIEIDGDQLLPLYDLTRQYAAREMSLNGPASDRNFWRDVAGTFGRRVDGHLQEGHFVRSPRSRLTIPDWGR